MKKHYSQQTIAARGGLNTDSQHGAVIPKISLSVAYQFESFEKPREFDYARVVTPNRAQVEQTITDLEGGVKSILTNCGTSAIHLLALALLSPHDLVVIPHDCYGGSYRLFTALAQKGFCKLAIIDQSNEQELLETLSKKPKLVLVESPSNPLLRVTDIRKIADLTHQFGGLVLVDNTFMTPILQKPFEFGADVIVHSCTKFLNGHSDLLTGILVFNDQTLADKVLWWSNTIGTGNSSFDAYLLQRGLRTLTVRVLTQQDSALKIVHFLNQHPKIKKVHHPSLPSTTGHEIAKKQQFGFGSLLSFELDCPEHKIPLFINELRIFTLAQSLGGTESLISHPKTMTHSGISAEARLKAGISDALLRLSVGLEDSTDLLNDLDHALNAI